MCIFDPSNGKIVPSSNLEKTLLLTTLWLVLMRQTLLTISLTLEIIETKPSCSNMIRFVLGTPQSGWWYTYPSEKYEFVSWDDNIPNMMGIIFQMFQTTNQIIYIYTV